MCGRYALALWPRRVRQQLVDSAMPSQEGPDDDDPRIRQTHNFAPGYYGLIYRAAVPDPTSSNRSNRAGQVTTEGDQEREPYEQDPEKPTNDEQDELVASSDSQTEGGEGKNYKLQAMQWGLVPFWTKRNPGYGSMLKTINCRDDSLAANGGMWNTMKRRKRCIVIAQGFYEWLKKDGGKAKVPYYTKRKDGQLMCFAGLWDCVKYEDAEEKLYTYTIVTTESNKQLNFLHDRMPVILENGSDDMFKWLDPRRSEWNKELQQILKPFGKELECYPVTQDVNKVGNDSPSFIVPVDSTQNKQNIANFFGKQSQSTTGQKRSRDDNDDLPTQTAEGKVTDFEAQENLERKRSPPAKKMRSAMSNGTKSPAKSGEGSAKITSFFAK